MNHIVVVLVKQSTVGCGDFLPPSQTLLQMSAHGRRSNTRHVAKLTVAKSFQEKFSTCL